jgi:hypothetical protein
VDESFLLLSTSPAGEINYAKIFRELPKFLIWTGIFSAATNGSARAATAGLRMKIANTSPD